MIYGFFEVWAGLGLLFAIINFFFYFKIWFHALEENILIKRQKKILIFIAISEFLLEITFIIPLIAKWFFHLGYKEILKANWEVN